MSNPPSQTPLPKVIARAIGVLVLGVPAVALLVKGPRGGEAVPAHRTVVEYWEKWNGEEEAAMRRVVDGFNDTVGRDKGIYVRYLSTSAVDQKTLTATAAGTPPDVAGVWDKNVAQFAAMDALEPLGDLAAAHGIGPGTYKPVYWDACHYQGTLYALVSTPNAVALHYNREQFARSAPALRAAGLDPGRAPRTIGELDAYAKALDQKDRDGRIAVAGYLPTEPGWYTDYTCYWFGGSWWDEPHHRFTFTDPAVVNAYTWIQSYSKRLGTAATSEFRGGMGTFDSPQNPFISGTLAMEQQGTFMANFIRHLRPSMDWGAAPFPSAVPGLTDVAYCESDVLVIPRRAAHPAEAFEFLAYVNRQDVMERLCDDHCKVSPLARVSESFLAHHHNPNIRLFERLAASPNARHAPQVPILAEVSDAMTVFTQRLALLEVTPEQGLVRLQDEYTRKYDAFMAIQRRRRSAAANH